MTKRDKKVVYIAHPVRGDVEGNKQKILTICREIHLNSSNIIPTAPYVTTLMYLDDNKAKERRLGMEANRRIFENGGFEELWLCGPCISDGMKKEVEWCMNLDIPIYCYNPELLQIFMNYKLTGKWDDEL